jgi:hypothetical protein
VISSVFNSQAGQDLMRFRARSELTTFTHYERQLLLENPIRFCLKSYHHIRLVTAATTELIKKRLYLIMPESACKSPGSVVSSESSEEIDSSNLSAHNRFK